MILIKSKWIEVPSDAPVVADLSVLTESQFQRVLRSLSQRKGADLLTAPQITMFNGQRGIVEVIREHPSRDGMDFSGVKKQFVPIIHEGNILLNVVADIGTPFRGGKRLERLAPFRRWDCHHQAPHPPGISVRRDWRNARAPHG